MGCVNDESGGAVEFSSASIACHPTARREVLPGVK